jgi:hypothetical protein
LKSVLGAWRVERAGAFCFGEPWRAIELKKAVDDPKFGSHLEGGSKVLYIRDLLRLAVGSELTCKMASSSVHGKNGRDVLGGTQALGTLAETYWGRGGRSGALGRAGAVESRMPPPADNGAGLRAQQPARQMRVGSRLVCGE